MSDEKDPREENANDEFEFYFSFTKPLVLDLPSSEERAIAAAWVQKLESDEDDKERLNYLKLLLFILQRGRLSGIFKNQPPSGPFEPFPPGFSIIDMGNLMLDQDDCQMFGGGDTRAVPYNIEISNDLREFVASQEVPKFGIQMYYAWSSDDPIHKWAHFDEYKFPQFILDKIKQLKENSSGEKVPQTTCKTKICHDDKSLKMKVKSPQEIESQGRSFHTYMGLVGRMGNFSKCEDDQEKGFQRPERKGVPQRRKMQRRSPTGEGEDMCGQDDYDNLVTNLGGGLTSANRPCLCPYPCHHQDCPDFRKGGPQSSNNQPMGACPVESGYPQRGRAVRQASPKRNLKEPTPETEGIASQQRCGATRTPDAPMSLQLPQDNQRGSSNKNGTCICSSAQCVCPCPRTSPVPKTPPFGQGAPMVTGTASRTFTKSGQRDPRSSIQCTTRPGGEFLTSFKAPDNYSDRQNPPGNTPVGGRSCASSPEKTLRPVTHCYDERNPDPCLTEVINRQPAMTGSQPYSDSPPTAPPETSFRARRQLFTPLAESTAIQDHVPQQSGAVCSAIAPGLMSHPDCENDDPQPQEFFSFIENDDVNEAQGQNLGGITGACKRPQNNSNAAAASQANKSLFAVPEGGGRLANIASVLQGLQQKTEAHREKCASGAIRKSPRADDNAGACPVQQGTQPRDNQLGYDAGGNALTAPRAFEPNMYFTPQVAPREQPNFREVQSAPAKPNDDQYMFLSNQIGYQGMSYEPHIKYFPTSTPPSPPRTNLLRYDNFMSMEQCSENEGGYDEENQPYDTSSETLYDDQALQTQSAPCPLESYFFSPPRARQGREDISHYTPPVGQSVKFQSSPRSRPQSPGGSSNVGSSPRRSPNAGSCRTPPQPQCPPPSPQHQTQPQCPLQRQTPTQSPHHSQEQWNTSNQSQQWSSPKKYVLPGDSWLIRDRTKGPVNINYLTPQYQPPDRGNIRPQAFSTGSKYRTAANINCPRPQGQPVCQRISFDQGNSMQDFDCSDQDGNIEDLHSSLFIEVSTFDADADQAACEAVPQC